MTVKDKITDTTPGGTRHAGTGLLYPPENLNPHTMAMYNAMKHLADSCFFDYQVKEDDANNTTIAILPGRAVIDGVVLVYAGGTVDLAALNNDTAYVWVTDNAGSPQIGSGADASGWPSVPHIKLAEVTLASGVITGIVDRRREFALEAEVDYQLTIETQGDTGSPSTISISGAAEVDFLRVRVADEDGFADATNATIAAGTNTTAVETITATKDLILKSHTDGTFKVDLTNATAETVTLRVGPAPLSPRKANYTNTLDVTHAAP